MSKLAKQYYRLKDGTKKLNCYHIAITKNILESANIKDDVDLNIKTKKGKIIIEEKRSH